ncbi:MAG: di-trans,poly-cis-decaprenylcistransferase [Candidatus Obscuribacterales bacterium]|nr:di-trans,poly-cis-decaprenylcistransferase [Steroidobacteraceae bacterium]
MDGNGRWASERGLPRNAGHRAGVKAVRASIEYCARRGIEALTLFAFSSENWQRPQEEVGLLMTLFLEALDREVADLDKNNIRICFIGDRALLSSALQTRIANAESRTANNTRLTVLIAVAYGGRWDITQAAKQVAEECVAGRLKVTEVTEAALQERMSLAGAAKGLVEPDLFIRTGGEQRISNFLLWDLAYTELYFSAVLWPDFDERELDAAIALFSSRERRFGLTSAQVAKV